MNLQLWAFANASSRTGMCADRRHIMVMDIKLLLALAIESPSVYPELSRAKLLIQAFR